MRVLTVLILGLLIVCVVDGNVIPDQALTADLQDVWNEDKFIIALSNIKVRKKPTTLANSIETLLAIKYKQTKTKLMLILDRRTKRVILESLDESGRRSAGSINVDSLAVNSPLKSLIILVHQMTINSRVDVYVDCIYEGSVPLKTTFREIAETEDSPFIEVFKEKKCKAKVYHSTITEALKREQCPTNLINMKQPSIFENKKELDNTKTHSTDSNQKKKSTDGIDGDDGSDQSNHSAPSTGQNDTKYPNYHPDNKKPSDKKDHRGRPSDREKNKKKDPRRPGSNSKPDKYDPLQPEQSDETDNLSYPELTSSPIALQPLHFTTGHRPTKRPKKPQHQSSTRPNGSNQYGPNKSDEIDDYLDESYSPSISQSSLSNIKYPIKRPDKQTDLRLDGSNGFNSHDFNKNPIPTSDESFDKSPDKLNRPGRSPGSDKYDYPDDTDLSVKRKPRRGDIGIQSLDERVCQTDDQIVKTLNELINATRKLGRELELNRQETQHLRHLIENCSACRTPIGE